MEIALQFGDFPLGNDNRGKKSSTLGLIAYRHVRTRLLEGSLVPGTKLTLRAVADDLEMSIQPVREAINRLIAEAALEAVSSRIIQVPVLPRETVDELWSIRILLDGEIAARLPATPRPRSARCCAQPATTFMGSISKT